MIIKALEIEGYMGCRLHQRFDMPRIKVLCGPNGVGKTTLISAIKYVLTGVLPSGAPVNRACERAAVGITLEDSDGNEWKFIRTVDAKGKASCFINDKSTTIKAFNTKLESIIGIPLDRLAIALDAEKLGSMKPQDLSAFLLRYIPEENTADELIELAGDEISEGAKEDIRKRFGDTPISLEMLSEYEGEIKAERKNLKSFLAEKKALLNSLPASVGEHAEEEFKQLTELEAKYNQYLVDKRAYDVARKNREAWVSQVTFLKEQIAAIPEIPAVIADLDSLIAEKTDAESTVTNLKVSANGITSALTQLKTTLDALNKPICPISPLVTCHENKTVAKAEIEKSIAEAENSLKLNGEEIQKFAAKADSLARQITSIQSAMTNKAKREALEMQLNAVSQKMPTEIVEPLGVALPADFLQKKNSLMNAMRAKTYDRVLLCEEITNLEARESTLDEIIKLTADKGCLKTAIIKKYASFFEEACNNRSLKYRPNTSFRFSAVNGLKAYMNNGKGFLPYDALSNGERAYMIFILLDMVNALLGSRILLIDELSVMDNAVFQAFIDILKDAEADYDHIVIACVNHNDTVDTLKGAGLL